MVIYFFRSKMVSLILEARDGSRFEVPPKFFETTGLCKRMVGDGAIECQDDKPLTIVLNKINTFTGIYYGVLLQYTQKNFFKSIIDATLEAGKPVMEVGHNLVVLCQYFDTRFKAQGLIKQYVYHFMQTSALYSGSPSLNPLVCQESS